MIFKTLGLGGGGIKGILHVGALLELSKHQPLKFDKIYGCSIGSIIATYVAFELPINNIVPLLKEYMDMDKFVPKFKLQHIPTAISAKGLYDMDMFESTLKEMFLKVGLDIKDKKISDAKMPLYIVASNITKGTPTVFSNDILLIDAIKCSCCIPAVFRPCELYGQLYVDGAWFSPCISSVIPAAKDNLIMTLDKQRKTSITPSSIESMSPLTYLSELYVMAFDLFHNAQMKQDTLKLKYPGLHSDSDISKFDIPDILKHSGKSLNHFISKFLL